MVSQTPAAYQYRINRLMLKQLQREESNQLKPLRAQVMGKLLPEAINILFNPLLYVASPQDPTVLLENYSVWSKELSILNGSVEDVLAEVLPELRVPQLKTDAKLSSAKTEAFDVLGGYFLCRPCWVRVKIKRMLLQKTSPGWSNREMYVGCLMDACSKNAWM